MQLIQLSFLMMIHLQNNVSCKKASTHWMMSIKTRALTVKQFTSLSDGRIPVSLIKDCHLHSFYDCV